MTLSPSVRRVAGLAVVIAVLGAATSPQSYAAAPPAPAPAGKPAPPKSPVPKGKPAKPRGGVKGSPGTLPPRR